MASQRIWGHLVVRQAASWPSGELLANACKAAYGKLTVDQKRSARKQFIPFGDEDALLPDAYEAFIKRRAREMAEALNEFLGL